MHVAQLLFYVAGVKFFGVDPLEVHVHAVPRAGVFECFHDGLVGVFQLHILAHQRNVERGALGFVSLEEFLPALQVARGFGVHAQALKYDYVQAFVHHHQRHIIDGFRIDALDHGVGRYVAEASHLGTHAWGQLVLGAAHQDVGLYPKLHHLLHRVLGGLGFQLARCIEVGDEGEVHHQYVVWTLPFHLADGLHVWQGLDVTHRTADLGDHKVVLRLAAEDLDAALDFIGDVRDDLDGLAQVIAATLFFDDALVDAAGGDVVGLRGTHVQKTFVVAQIKVGFSAVFGHVALPVFIRVECAGIDIDVGIQFLDGHSVATALQELGE